MVDIQYIREHSDNLRQAILDKQMNPGIVDTVLMLDEERRALMVQVESLRAEKNKLTKDQVEDGKRIKAQLKDLEPTLKEVETKFQEALLEVPNPAASDVPIGADESGNQVLYERGEKPHHDFLPKSHLELASNLDWFDSKRAVRIAGNRAYFLKGEAVLLEQAIHAYALSKMVKLGFTPMTVPWMVNQDAMTGTGYFPWGKADHYYTQDGQHLIGTSEVSLTSYHKDELLFEKDLPIKLCGISPCFRREVGSYGKDTQGFFRVHQFTKVEMVVLTVADEDITREMHDQMKSYAEELLSEFGLAYRVLLMCTGDMGAGQRRKYDLETWFAGQQQYRETHSDSYFNDFQSRRLNIRYRAKDGSVKYVYTLNNTLAATPRLLAAVMEHYQQADGSIAVPPVLVPYLGKQVLGKKE